MGCCLNAPGLASPGRIVVNRLTGMNRHGLLGVAASAAIALAGCGGDSNKQLSYSDFSKKAMGAIECTKT